MNEILNTLQASLPGLLPELCLTAGLAVVLLADLWRIRPTHGRGLHLLTLAVLATAGGLVWLQAGSGGRGFLLGHMLLLDGQAIFYKVLVLGGAAIALLHSLVTGRRWPGEFFVLVLGLALGGLLLTMSTHLLMVYLSVELISLSSYPLVALRREGSGAEGGLKYLLFGATASALMLYGMSLLYGLTGTLHFTDPAFGRGLYQTDALVLLTVTVLTLSGLLFKISATPLHLWAPDAYEAAEMPVVSLFSVAPKAAALLALMRLMAPLPDALNSLLLLPVAAGSLAVGNFAALRQTHLRRLMAYSGIGQAGFLLMGLVAANSTGFQATTFYLSTYLFANTAVLLLTDLLAPSGRLESLSEMGRRYPLAAGLLTLGLVSLAGLPPAVGFTAKLLLFSSLWDAYQTAETAGLLVLLLFGLLNTVVALGYYFRLPYQLFFRVQVAATPPPLSLGQWLLAAGLLLPVLGLFFKPDALLNLIAALPGF